MDPEQEASSRSDSSTTSGSSSSISNLALISRPTINKEDDLELAESLTAESGFEEGLSFPAGQRETAHGQGGASLFYFPEVEKSYHMLNAGSAAVILDNPSVKYCNNETASEIQTLAAGDKLKELVPLGEVVLPPLPASGNLQLMPVEHESPEIYSKDCIENDRIIRKTAVISKAHNFKKAYNYATFLTGNNLEVDAELCENEKLEKDLNKKHIEVQNRLQLRHTDINQLRQEIAETKIEYKAELQKKKDRMKYLKERFIIEKKDLQTIENEQHEVQLKMRNTKKGGGTNLRRQLSEAEQQIDMQQKQIQELEEKVEVKLELQRMIEKLLQLVEMRVPLCSRKQATTIDLNLTCNAVSVQPSSESKKRSKRTGMESASVPVTAFQEESVRSTSHFAQLTIDSEYTDIGDDHNAIPESLGSSSLDTGIKENHMFELAAYFDSQGLSILISATEIFAHEVGDVERALATTGTQTAVHKCLKCWRNRQPKQATFQALLTFVRRSGREDIAENIILFFEKNYRSISSTD